MHRLARRRQSKGLISEAREIYQQLLGIEPNRVATLNNLAVLEITDHNLWAAELHLEKAFQALLKPSPSPAQGVDGVSSCKQWALLYNTACQLALQRARFVQAWLAAKQLVRLDPSPRSATNVSVCLAMLQRPEAALRAQALALGLTPPTTEPLELWAEALLWKEAGSAADSAMRHQQLLNAATYALQANPRSQAGWRLLRATLGAHASAWADQPHPWQRLWDGTWTATLRIWDEQGYGDCLQQLRWLEQAAQHTNQLEVLLRPELLELVRRRLKLPSHCRLASLQAVDQPWMGPMDAHLPITGLAGVFGGNPLTVCGRPYLHSGKRAKAAGAIRVGVAWAAGGKTAADARRAAELRSLPAELLLEWMQTFPSRLDPGVPTALSWVSLQVGPEGDAWQPRLRAMGIESLPSGASWECSAAVVEGLDAVVSVDTAVAHLAGALGVPTITLLNDPCDWRWGQSGDRTQWYDCWWLARCERTNRWSTALETATTLLREIVNPVLPSTHHEASAG